MRPLAVQVGELALERFDVLLVGFDAVLVRPQPLLDARIVALLAAAHRLLLRQRLPCLGKRLLFAGELVLQDLALALARARALAHRLAREARRRLRRRLGA